MGPISYHKLIWQLRDIKSIIHKQPAQGRGRDGGGIMVIVMPSSSTQSDGRARDEMRCGLRRWDEKYLQYLGY